MGAAAVAGLSARLDAAAPLSLAVLAVVVAAVWARPAVAAVLVVAVAPAVAGLKFTVALPGLNLAMIVVVGCALVTFFRRPAVWPRTTATEVATFVFAATAALFAGYHAAVDGSSLASLLRAAAQPALLWLAFWTANRAVGDQGDLRLVLRWVLALSFVVSLLAMAQFFDLAGVPTFLKSISDVYSLPHDGSGPRVTGPFPIWHSLCGYLLIPVVLTLSMLLTGSRSIASRWQLVVLVAAQLTAVVMAVTVTSFIWLAVAVPVAAALLGRLGRSLVVLVLAGFTAVTVFSSVLESRLAQQTTEASGAGGGLLPQTVAYRVLVWERDFLPLLRQAAGAGVGNDLPSTVQFAHTENQYFTWILRGGLLLAATGIAVLIVMFLEAVSAFRRASTHRETLAALVGVVVFVPAAMTIWPYLTNAGLPLALFSFAGAAMAGRSRRSASHVHLHLAVPPLQRSPL